MSREKHLRMLNEQYVQASLAGDVEWYRAHLADEFVCIDSDGSVLDKNAFLQMTANGSELAEYRLDEVDLRQRSTGAMHGLVDREERRSRIEPLRRRVRAIRRRLEGGIRADHAAIAGTLTARCDEVRSHFFFK